MVKIVFFKFHEDVNEYLNLYYLNYNSMNDSKIKQLVDLIKKYLLLELDASALT